MWDALSSVELEHQLLLAYRALADGSDGEHRPDDSEQRAHLGSLLARLRPARAEIYDCPVCPKSGKERRPTGTVNANGVCPNSLAALRRRRRSTSGRTRATVVSTQPASDIEGRPATTGFGGRAVLSASHEHCKADASRHKQYGDPEQREKARTVAAVLKSRF